MSIRFYTICGFQYINRLPTLTFLAPSLFQPWLSTTRSDRCRKARTLHGTACIGRKRDAATRSRDLDDEDYSGAQSQHSLFSDTEEILLPRTHEPSPRGKQRHSLQFTPRKTVVNTFQATKSEIRLRLKLHAQKASKDRGPKSLLWWKRSRTLWRQAAITVPQGSSAFEFTRAFEITEVLVSSGTFYPHYWHDKIQSLYGRDRPKNPGQLLNLDKDVDVWISELFARGVSTPSVRAIWKTWKYQVRTARWDTIMLRCLSTSPPKALCFLTASYTWPVPNFSTVADCLMYLDRCCEDQVRSHPGTADRLRRLVVKFMDPSRWPLRRISGRHFSLLLHHLPADKGRRIFRLLLQWRVPLSNPRLLNLVDYFTSRGDTDAAIEALTWIRHRQEISFTDERVLRRCANLLKLDFIQEDPTNPNFKILPALLELGLIPNVILHTLIMENAFRSGATAVAWDIFDFMQKQGIQPDSYCYLSLLKDAVARHDAKTFRSLQQAILQHHILRNNDFLIAHILHGMRVLYGVEDYGEDIPRSKPDVFTHMLSVYSQAYDLNLLKSLGIISPDYAPPTITAKVGGAPPSLPALGVMIYAFLETHNGPAVMQHLYNKFRDLVSNNDPVFAPLTRTTHIYNTFLLFFSRHRNTLPKCLEIMGDMTRDAYKLLETKTQETDVPERDVQPANHCAPTVRTWNILLLAFMRNRHPRGAEKVRIMMHERGIKPDRVTYNVLISGYSSMQMVRHAVNTLEEMRKDHWATDHFAIRGLSYVQDRDKLKEEMQRLDREVAWATQEAKEGPDQKPLSML